MVNCRALESPKLLELQLEWVARCHGGMQKVWGLVLSAEGVVVPMVKMELGM